MSDAYDHFQRGKSLLRDGMPAQATVSLEKAKRLEPDKASIREALGIAYFRITRWDAAEAEFRKVLELSPVDDYAHFALGRALAKQGRTAEAETPPSSPRASSATPTPEPGIRKTDRPGAVATDPRPGRPGARCSA